MANTSGSQQQRFIDLTREVLRSATFLEKALVLLLTVVLSGAIAPLVVAWIDAGRTAREAVMNAQTKLFNDVSETLLATQTLMLDVSWFGTEDAKHSEQQRKAFERYSERIVDLVVKWRTQMSRAQTLTSPHVSKKLDAFLVRFLGAQDSPMNRLWVTCAAECDWQAMHETNLGMLGEANKLVAEIASDLRLDGSR